MNLDWKEHDITFSVRVKQEDPASISHVQCFLKVKGFIACQCYRIAHDLWANGRKASALLIQNRVSEIFATDIHPGVKIGKGIFLDHGTRWVLTEDREIMEAIIDDLRVVNQKDPASISHVQCFLKVKGFRAWSMVQKPVPAGSIVVGNPARLIGVEISKLGPPFFCTSNFQSKNVIGLSFICQLSIFIRFKHCTSTNAACIHFLFKHSTSTMATYCETGFPCLSSPLPIHEKNSKSPGDDLLLLKKKKSS
ncbi:hypothetical protein BUALT_Bualt18G0027700 [Buddleja alternifolia]|uniref:Serine acetyltransferase N-terminal domain-containing protein n=1 Tax=Buddleja alternifolia TaxID=168488 RepID=A0AAV6W3H5_9LAMI|nr:hypothetical protein BUALT_Bualt18G0027700 [Buddleja alternifolia]